MPYRGRRGRQPIARNHYFILYNLLSLLGYIYMTATVLIHDDPGPRALLTYLDHMAILHGLAGVEILHMLTDRYHNRYAYFDPTRVLKITARNLIIWAIMYPYPVFVLGYGRRAFLGCMLAWSVAGTLRYLSFVLVLTWGDAQPVLLWLRYTASIFLHPVALLCEVRFVYLAIGVVDGMSTSYEIYLLIGLLLYIIESVALYIKMITGRLWALGV